MTDTASDVPADERLVEIEDELYGGPAQDFVRRRDEAARGARRDGDRELADAIAALRKPTAAASALNSFVRDEPAVVDGLLDVGNRLRDAVRRGDGDAIRELMRERARTSRAVMDEVRRHADDRGEPLSPSTASQVEQTLRAAMTSDEEARQVCRGVLATALTASALDAMQLDAAHDVSGPVGTNRRGGTVGTGAPRTDTSRRRRAEAEQRASDAAEAVERADRVLQAAISRRDELERERNDLRRRLDDAEQQLRDARQAEADATAELRAARTTARTAGAELARIHDAS